MSLTVYSIEVPEINTKLLIKMVNWMRKREDIDIDIVIKVGDDLHVKATDAALEEFKTEFNLTGKCVYSYMGCQLKLVDDREELEFDNETRN